MMKNKSNRFSLWIIAVFLTFIVFSISLDQAFAHQPTLSSWVADDPDDLDTIFSAGDTLTITFGAATNATVGPIVSQAAIDGNYTFGGTVSDGTYTGLWTDATNFQITIITTGTTPVLTTTVVTATAGNTIGIAGEGAGADATHTLDPAVTTSALTGDFGLKKKTGGDIAGISPSYSTAFAENEYPISIGDTKFKQSQLAFAVPTTVIETGKPVQVKLLIYDNDGPSYIAQVELYTNINGLFRDVSHSDTHIVYKKGNPTTILDPNGFFSDVVLSSSVVNQKLQLTYEITFAKEMEKSDIIIQARDAANNVGILTVSEAWQVIQAPTVVETTDTPTDEPTDGSVPGEIKVKSLNVEKASYLKDEEILFFGTVDEYKFGTAITIIIRNPSNNFLTLISTTPDKDGYFEAKTKLDSKFKTDGTYTATAFADDQNRGTQAIFYFSRDAPIPTTVKTSPVQSTQAEPTTPKPRSSPSFVDPEKDPQSYVDRYNNEERYREWFDVNFPDYTIYEAVGLAEPTEEKVPGWIKNNAKWWSEGQIDDGTFVSGIQFLMTKKIIDIPDLPEQASEKARPSFVDPEKDPQSYVDRYNNEASYKEWFDKNHPDYTIEEAVGIPEPIPGWIKNNAKWWADGQISEDDFVGGIEWLVEQGIIKI
ncbi:MAG: exported protein of unknown function [Nitrosopumilales archaeon]|nr:MAG: exported protein of unknown function [Nitrosopumilales archaeon]